MTITEATRHALHDRLEVVLGPEEATTLMEMLPPVGWADVATKRDLDHLALQIRAELHEALHLSEAGVRTELRGEMQSLASELRGEMQALASELRGQMESLSAELRGEVRELRTEVQGEMRELRTDVHRTMQANLRWSVAANLSIATVLFAAIRLL